MLLKAPYFLEDPKWYTFVPDRNPAYELTDKAPKKARESYKKYYALLNREIEE